MKIETSILINATPARVWSIFTEFDKYPEWNPFVKSLKGTVAVGKQIEVQLPSMKFKPTVVSFKKEEEFAWLGHLWVKGLFDGRHSFRLINNNDGTTTFYHTEDFSGILVPIFKKKLLNDTLKGFEHMNQKLKARAEELADKSYENSKNLNTDQGAEAIHS